VEISEKKEEKKGKKGKKRRIFATNNNHQECVVGYSVLHC